MSASTTVKIKIPQDKIAGFCKRHYIRKLSLFGSVLRDDFGPQSDVDVLVEFDPAHIPGLMRFVGMECGKPSPKMSLASLLP